MKNFTVKSLLNLALVLVLSGSWMHLSAAGRFQTKASGAWSAAGTWLLVSGTSGTGIPAAVDTVDILSGFTVTTGTTTA